MRKYLQIFAEQVDIVLAFNFINNPFLPLCLDYPVSNLILNLNNVDARGDS